MKKTTVRFFQKLTAAGLGASSARSLVQVVQGFFHLRYGYTIIQVVFDDTEAVYDDAEAVVIFCSENCFASFTPI